MRRAGHIVERDKNTYRLVVSAGKDPATGKRRQLTKTFHGSKSQAQQALANFVAEVSKGTYQRGTTGRTVGQLLDAWLDMTAEDLSPNTAAEWRRWIRLYILPHLGGAAVGKVEPWDIDQLYRQLLRCGGRGGRPLAAATVAKCHTILRLAFAQAVAWKWRPDNPALAATPPRVAKSDPTPPEADEARRLLERAEELDPDWAAYLRLSTAIGGRRSEACALRWPDVSVPTSTVKIRRAVIRVDWTKQVREYPKTAASRRQVAIDPATVSALKAVRQRQAERALACGHSLARDAFLFSPQVDGSEPWHPDVATKRFGRLRKRAGLPHVRLHDLRHYMATQLIAAGMDVVTVAGRGGWSNPTTLLTTYAHWVPARDQAAAEVMGGLLDGRG